MLNFGMIYTVGHAANYRAAFDSNKAEGKGPPQKVGKCDELEIRQADGSVSKEAYPGGWVWRTREAAQRWLEENGKADIWSVWGVDADWKDSEPGEHGEQEPFHLLKDSPLIDIYA